MLSVIYDLFTDSSVSKLLFSLIRDQLSIQVISTITNRAGSNQRAVVLEFKNQRIAGWVDNVPMTFTLQWRATCRSQGRGRWLLTSHSSHAHAPRRQPWFAEDSGEVGRSNETDIKATRTLLWLPWHDRALDTES